MSIEPRQVFIRMLGGFRVVINDECPKLRSHTAERLLALLALRLGRSVSKSEVLSPLWPDSDGDRQAQNLRKAISDIRQVIQPHADSPTILLTQGDMLWLDPDQVSTDVRQLRFYLTGIEPTDREESLLAATGMYQGPLLPGMDDSWAVVHRMEIEEQFAQAVDSLILLLSKQGRHDEALRIGKQAVTVAPLREDIHVALMRAYGAAGLRSQAIRQFEELETLLADEWGEAPSPKSLKAFEEIDSNDRDQQLEYPRETAGGAMPPRSRFYIERDCDHAFKRAIDICEGTILIHGARQVGKTSLLYKVLGEIPQKRVVTDFQALDHYQLSSAESFCRSLAYGFSTQLGVKLDFDETWNTWIGPNANLDAIVEAGLRATDGPVVWAMDEADRLFGCDFADDFFGLVRSWHNRRGLESETFSKLTLAIAYATEAHLFIRDVNQSPFNVGLRIPVQDFGPSESRELSYRYGLRLADSDIQTLVTVTGGQPFLARKALDAIAYGGYTIHQLQIESASESGPFGDHLRRLLSVATRDDDTAAEVIRFLNQKPFTDPKTPLRLVAGGMLKWDQEGKLVFRVPAYRKFLSDFLVG
jgi:DNA-binding SARP family transcriptional activator